MQIRYPVLDRPRQSSNPQLVGIVAAPARARDIWAHHLGTDPTNTRELVKAVFLVFTALQRTNGLVARPLLLAGHGRSLWNRFQCLCNISKVMD